MQIKAKKSLGQNFLIDKNIINKIVEKANIKFEDTILEIGPGTGNLTEFILKKKPNSFLKKKNTKFQYHTPPENQDRTRLMKKIIFLLKNKNLTN